MPTKDKVLLLCACVCVRYGVRKGMCCVRGLHTTKIACRYCVGLFEQLSQAPFYVQRVPTALTVRRGQSMRRASLLSLGRLVCFAGGHRCTQGCLLRFKEALRADLQAGAPGRPAGGLSPSAQVTCMHCAGARARG